MDLGLYNLSIDRTESPSFGFLIMIDFFRFQKLVSWLAAFASKKYWGFPISETRKSEKKLEEDDGDKMSREEMKWVMENLGLSSHDESAESLPLFGSIDEVSKLFDEREPCMAEVKGAFAVFDANGDGFIDVEELQRVLCVLGFKEGEGIQNCRRMIQKFDDNKDGKIDFDEFVKLMNSVA